MQRPLGSATLYMLVYSTRIRAQQPLPKGRMFSSSISPSHTYIFFALYTRPLHVPDIFLLHGAAENSPMNSRRFRVIWNNNIFVIHGYNVKKRPACERNARCASRSWAKWSLPIKETATQALVISTNYRIYSSSTRRGDYKTVNQELPFRRLNSRREMVYDTTETDLYLATAGSR